jgi:hypothetical protein
MKTSKYQHQRIAYREAIEMLLSAVNMGGIAKGERKLALAKLWWKIEAVI